MDKIKMASAVNVSIWDKEALFRRLLNKEKIIVRLIRLCLQDLPSKFKQLQDAVDSNNDKLIYQSAHAIKGIAANISADSLYKLSSEMEASIEVSDKTERTRVLDKFIIQLDVLMIELGQYIQSSESNIASNDTSLSDFALIMSDEHAHYLDCHIPALVNKLSEGFLVESEELDIIKELCKSPRSKEVFEKLRLAINQFDNEFAAELLKILSKLLSLSDAKS